MNGILTFQPPSHFDHQATGTFGECERMAFYSLGLGRKPKSSTTALDWGGTFHACVDVLLTEANISKCQEIINTKMIEDLDDHYGRTPDRMMEALYKWVEWFAANPIEILRTEQPTIIRCDSGISCPYFEEGCGLEYGGIMDAIVRWQGYVGPLDRKTTVMRENDPVSQYRLSHQMQGYDWIASHLQGNHCWGAIIERIITNKSRIEFGRFPVSYSREAIREWVINEKVLQAEFNHKIKNYPQDETMWRQNRGRCYEPYPCQYRDVCTSSKGKFREKVLLEHYRESRWDFMNRDEVEDAVGTGSGSDSLVQIVRR